MHFSAPWALLLLLVLPLAYWRWGRQRPAAVPYPDLSVFAPLPTTASWTARHGALVLQALAFACLIVALAGPRWPDLRTRLDTDGVAILMVVDVSGSMAERDFFWDNEPITRLEAVQRIFRLFVAGGRRDELTFAGREGDLVGLIRFATRPEVACPLTLHHRTLLGLLDAEQPTSTSGESETNISDALALGLARLRSSTAKKKVLVLLTDGEHNVPQPRSRWSPRQAGQVAASLGIVVYTVDAGSDILGPGERPEVREESVAVLKDIAGVTGGRYLPASDTAALATAMRQIDQLERVAIESFQYRRYHEGNAWFALAAFALFAIAEVLTDTVWRRLP